MTFQKELAEYELSHPYQTLDIDNCTFRYCLCGKSDSPHTLVYLIGGTGNPSGWFRHVQAMEEDYHIMLCDYPLGIDRMEPMAHHIASLVKALNLGKVVWIGASMGGYLAQLLAKFYPDLTDALVLYATSCLTAEGIEGLKKQYRGMGIVYWMVKYIPYGILKSLILKPSMTRLIPKDLDPKEQSFIRDFIQWVCDSYTKEKDLHLTALQMDLVNVTPVSSKDFSYIGGRTLLILPAHDTAFTPDMQQDLIDTISGAEVRHIDGGHLATITKAAEYCRITGEFLNRIS